VPESEKAQRRAARERVSAYYERELAILIGHVEDAIARHRTGDIDVHDVDALIHQYSKAARKLWGFCWSRGDMRFAAGILDQFGNDEGSWWEAPAPRQRPGERRESES
jgi:hypothetical protein